MEDKGQEKIGQILINKGIITPEQLKKAVNEHNRTNQFLGKILVSQGAVSEEQMVRALSEELGFACVDLSKITIEPQVVDLISEDVARRLKIIPLFIIQDTITTAMTNPLDVEAVDELRNITKKEIKPVFACPSAIDTVINNQYRKTPEVESFPETAEVGEAAVPKPSQPVDEKVSSLKQAASLAPVVKMVNNIITNAVKMGASDIHLEPQEDKFVRRLRIDGILSSILELPLERQSAAISRIKIMANMDIAEKRLPQDGRFSMKIAGRDIDLRVSSFPTINGENVVMRILDRSKGVLQLEQLGFSKDNLKTFSRIIERPYGIILVTGPTGSGKTTTLYAALNKINTLEKNIITLEDPVEYEIPNIRQSQVNVKAGLTFASGLRSMLRQDPDIVMIGEIRDKETADIAIHAALTGHLVFSTLHTNDAPSAATRLIDMGVEPFLVASSVIAILSQRLVRVLCSNCKKSYKPHKELLEDIGLDNEASVGDYTFYKEVGCSKCNNRGYTGRSGIFELLIPDDKVKTLITKKSSATELKNVVKRQGMKTLHESGLEKVISGITSVAELLRVTEIV